MSDTAPTKAVATAAPKQPSGQALEMALGKGDLSALSAEDRTRYLVQVCESLGLNPLTRPFEFLSGDKGKVVLYARKDCTDQLRRIHCVTLEVVAREIIDELCVVHVRATMPAKKGEHKRQDEDLGVVHIGKLSGEAKANAIMKAITKAKRRTTLSICGLGLLDETEVEDSPGLRQQVEAHVVPARQAAPQAIAHQPAPQQAPAPERAGSEALAELKRLKELLKISPEGWAKSLAKRGVTTARDLSPGQVHTMITALQSKVVAAQLDADLAKRPGPLDQQGVSPDGLAAPAEIPF